MNGVQWYIDQEKIWRDSVLKDIRILVVKNLTKVVMEKPAWLDLVEKSKTHRGLQDERISYTHTHTYIHTYIHTVADNRGHL